MMSDLAAHPDLVDGQRRRETLSPARSGTYVVEALVAVHDPAQRQIQLGIAEQRVPGAAAITATKVGGAIGASPR